MWQCGNCLYKIDLVRYFSLLSKKIKCLLIKMFNQQIILNSNCCLRKKKQSLQLKKVLELIYLNIPHVLHVKIYGQFRSKCIFFFNWQCKCILCLYCLVKKFKINFKFSFFVVFMSIFFSICIIMLLFAPH